MDAVIVLLHKNCIYHFNAPSDGVCVFGSGKKDDVYVEDLKPRHIVVSVDKDTFIVDSRSTYGVLTNSIPFDSFLVLDKADRTLVFVSEARSITSDTELRLPYNCSYKVGRADTNDIVLKFPFVSSEHFILRSEQGIVRVEDRDSTNGLFLNGKKVGIARMRSGDVLSVMSIRIYLNNGVLRFENVGNNLKFNLFSEKSSVTASRLSGGSGRLLTDVLPELRKYSRQRI